MTIASKTGLRRIPAKGLSTPAGMGVPRGTAESPAARGEVHPRCTYTRGLVGTVLVQNRRVIAVELGSRRNAADGAYFESVARNSGVHRAGRPRRSWHFIIIKPVECLCKIALCTGRQTILPP